MARGQSCSRDPRLAQISARGPLAEGKRQRDGPAARREGLARHLREVRRRAYKDDDRQSPDARAKRRPLRSLPALGKIPIVLTEAGAGDDPEGRQPMLNERTWQRLGGAWLLIAAATLAIPSFAEQTETPKRGGTLEFAVDSEPPNYDCHANISFAFLHPIAPHYSTLLKFDGANYPQVKGDLAESWSVSADRLTYTFKLRPNILFHDGSQMTSADVKASYERIVHPPPGVASARKVDYAAISSIDTPDPLTVVFRLQWPEAAMGANFASPWNCIYSAARLAADPQFPKTNILGTGAFVFVEYVKGQYWRGKRWDKYFLPGKPYLDGYQADFIPGNAVMAAYKSGRIAAEVRSVTPPQRDD